MPWLSNIGKLLLTFAGLVALLDVAGPTKVADWAKRAKKRHDDTARRWATLNAARPDEARVRRTAMWTASASPDIATVEASLTEPEVVNGLTVEDLLAFRREAWTAIRADSCYDEASLKSPQRTFPFFEEKAYQFFEEQLPEPRRTVLKLAHGEVQKWMRRQQQWMSLALLGSALPGTAALGWWLHVGGMPWVFSIAVAYPVAGMAALVSGAALLTPRFVTALLRAAATVRLGLARAAVKAMGKAKDARPLRKIALGMFIVGSFLDLVGGW